MISQPNGHKYYDYPLWSREKNQPYDYQRYGLIKHLLSHKITETDNPVTLIILNFYEQSLIFLMKYVDRLKHFKDAAWKNR